MKGTYVNTNTVWDAKLKVGSDIIDNQHKVLFDLIKDLNNAIRTEVNIRVVDILLGVLRDYAFQHFQTEEEHFPKHADSITHCLEHYTLIKGLNTFIHDFRNNRTKVEPTPAVFLEHWLFEHIEKFDKPCFADKAVSVSLSSPPDAVDAFDPHLKERRHHKRIPHNDLVDENIQAHCYNATKLKSGMVDIVNLSTGGLMLRSTRTLEVDDLLIVGCRIGRTFKMKEKVKVISAHDQMYGVQFISPSRETLVFFTELYGAVHMNNSSYVDAQ